MKYLLLPFGWLYGAIASLRNKLYDKGIFKSYESSLKTIVIGNLQVGGSGKTPHTALLYDLLKDRYKIAILSRGYGRSTRGLVVADENADADTLGDESFWYYRNYKDAIVVVSESRKKGLQYLEKQNVDLVLLDDAFQHRAVNCTINLMLSDYHAPYFNDHAMPYGRLREWKTGDKRADIIIITKSPHSISLEQKIEMIQSINPYDHQEVFFTTIKAFQPYPLKGEMPFDSIHAEKIIAMSGIANPSSFIETCTAFGRIVVPLTFNDHHDYKVKDIQQMRMMMDDKSVVLVTEKDAVKLIRPDLFNLIPDNKVFIVPVKPHFLFNETGKFEKLIRKILS